MNGEWMRLVLDAAGERLLLASMDVAILAVLVWGLLHVFRRCPPRLAGLLWLLVLAKPLLTLALGPAASLLVISLPRSVASRSASASDPAGAAAGSPALDSPGRPQNAPSPPVSPWDAGPSATASADERQAAQTEMPGEIDPLGAESAPSPAAEGAAPIVERPGGNSSLSPALPGPLPDAEKGSDTLAESPAGLRTEGPSGTAISRWLCAKWRMAVALMWMAGAAWSTAVMSARCLRMRRRIALCPAADRGLEAIYADVLREMGYRRRPARLVVGEFFTSPALVDCWQPAIVLPGWFVEQSSDSQLRWTLKHEVAHLLHADHWADLVRRTARALFFFHPAIRLAARRWEEAAEAACDRALVRSEQDVVDYSDCLLWIVERVGSRRIPAAAEGLFATQRQIQRRIGRLLALTSADFGPLRRRSYALLLPAIVLALSGFSLGQPPAEPVEAQAGPQAASAPQAAPAPQDVPAPRPEPVSAAGPGSVLDSLVAALHSTAAQAATGPSKSRHDAETTELLARILEANRFWFEGPPRQTPGYRYTFVHRNGKRQEFEVADPQSAGASVRQGITYAPLAAVLLRALVDSGSSAAHVEGVERSDAEIRIRFRTDGSLGSRLGGGVSGSWQGYIYYKLGDGVLRLDAKTLLPIELTSTWRDAKRNEETLVTERLSEPVEVADGHWVPLRVEAVRQENTSSAGEAKNENSSRFDWTFKVYQPGLWLFDAELAADATATGYHLEDLVIGGVQKPQPQASSAALAAIEKSKAALAGLVRQYVEANRAWLLPDLAKRKGLVYDYTQEDGYRERITFDRDGNVLVHLVSDRQSSKSPSSGQLHLFTADGREANGMAGEPFLTVRPADPASTSPFSGRKMLNNLATGWGWECASMRLARGADDFAITVDEKSEDQAWKMVLRPLRNRPTLHLGTMLRFISWAYLPNWSFDRCEIRIDRKGRLPLEERYFQEGKDQPICTIRFEDWLDTPEGKAPGKVVGRATYQKRGQSKEIEEVFDFTGKYRVTETGILLLDEVASTFATQNSGSTGRVAIVKPSEDDGGLIQKTLKQVEATADFLAHVEQPPQGRSTTVPCRWGEEAPVWLNGKYEHQATGQGEDSEEPPFVIYRNNLGIRSLRPEVLADGKVRVTVDVYSTIYYQGYSFEVTVALLDGQGRSLAAQTAAESTKTMGQPEQKPVVLDFGVPVQSDQVASIAVALKVKRQWGSHHFRGMWMRDGDSNDRQTSCFPGARDWGPEQAMGEPDSRHIGGDYKHAWSPLTPDGQQEWLELSYREPVRAVGVNVYETLGPGAVHKVTCYSASGKEQVAWEGNDPTPADTQLALGVSRIRFNETVETDRVRIWLDSPAVKGWNEIDAVGLVEAAEGSSEREHWARDAAASSTFAEGERPDTITYEYDGPHTELKYDDGFHDWMRSLGGGQWQVVRFTRPKNTPYLDAVRVLASSYGSRPRNTAFYILDQDMKVLQELPSETRIRSSGPMHWFVFHAPSVEVPETFHVAFQFNSQQYGGIYVATRRLAEGEDGQSFTCSPGQDLKPLEVDGAGYAWMIRAYLSETPDEKARKDDELRRQREAAQAAINAKGPGWSPAQATGAPDAYELPTGGDRQSAWASQSQDDQAEWLELVYAKRVNAIGVDIYETFNPGAVHKVTVVEPGGIEKTGWEGTDPTPAAIAGGKGISRIRFDQPIQADRILLHLDSVCVKGWNEIDAVGLVESAGSVLWAEKAEASSTYASRGPSQR